MKTLELSKNSYDRGSYMRMKIISNSSSHSAHYIYTSFIIILSLLVAYFLAKELSKTDEPATKQELIDIIEATPCALEPISRAIEQNPISIVRANSIAIQCQRNILRSEVINEQREALKYVEKDEWQ
ncbi:hypothetical protein ACLKFZ_005090 [Klebsiella pneumoniae]|uniref:hypothetical protein n=1 Tax=Klebsiella quasipneumoniae TaxID=1463165 RepID=UPI002ABC605C|nr:hypothetical protein [Klebsiella quasipneumoniae]MDZ3077049.1 hypothetical protein [Klebsiella quasipneumoniae]